MVDEPLYAHWLRLTGAPRPYRDAVLASQDADGGRVLAGLSRAPHAPGARPLLFAKHMTKHALLLPPALLAARPGRSLLLLRRPADLLSSWSDVMPASLEETGLPAACALYSALRCEGRSPAVFLAEDLAAAPEATLRLICAALSVPFDASMLSWPAGPRPEDGVWAPHWYATTHASTGFAPLRGGGGGGAPLAPHLRELEAEAAPFYGFLAARAVRPAAAAGAAPAPPPPPAPLPGFERGGDDGERPAAAAAGIVASHQGATHSYAPDPRNASVLVGIRDGVTGLWGLHRRPHATVSVLDGGFVLGDGVWEGIRLHRGVLLFAKAHLQRLFEGLASLDLDPGISKADLLRAVYSVVDANQMDGGVHVRLMVTRGLKATPFQDPRCTVGGATIVVLAEHKAPPPSPPPLRLATVAVRRGGPDAQDPALNSHSKGNCVAACVAAGAAGADEALMLDPDGFVCTCNSTNFFIVRNGEVWTAPEGHLMPGVTRSAVLRLARAAGLPAHERRFSLAAVYGADAAWVTGTFAGLLRVGSVDGRAIGAAGDADAGGAVFARLRALYAEAVEADAARGR